MYALSKSMSSWGVSIYNCSLDNVAKWMVVDFLLSQNND